MKVYINRRSVQVSNNKNVNNNSIGNEQIITQKNYKEIAFDDTKNTVLIKKPIIDEEFTITIIVDVKGSLGKYTQCDLAFSDKSNRKIFKDFHFSIE